MSNARPERSLGSKPRPRRINAGQGRSGAWVGAWAGAAQTRRCSCRNWSPSFGRADGEAADRAASTPDQKKQVKNSLKGLADAAKNFPDDDAKAKLEKILGVVKDRRSDEAALSMAEERSGRQSTRPRRFGRPRRPRRAEVLGANSQPVHGRGERESSRHCPRLEGAAEIGGVGNLAATQKMGRGLRGRAADVGSPQTGPPAPAHRPFIAFGLCSARPRPSVTTGTLPWPATAAASSLTPPASLTRSVSFPQRPWTSRRVAMAFQVQQRVVGVSPMMTTS